MAYSSTEGVTLIASATLFVFAPNELIYSGQPQESVNQVVQESESGEIKLQQLDGTARRMFEFRLNNMPAADRTASGGLVRGFDTLKDLITNPLLFNYREDTFELSLPGDAFTVTQVVRYWSDRFHHPEHDNRAGYFGNGSTVLTFREEI